MKPHLLSSVASIDVAAEPILDLSGLPQRMDRRAAAKLISQTFFPVSPRSLERWPLATRILNGRALLETREVIAYARAQVAQAPAVMGGRRTGRTAA